MDEQARAQESEGRSAQEEGERSGQNQPDEAVSKKAQILSLYHAGVDTIEDLALLTDVRPSYVGAVLQEEDLVTGYFDLYTSTSTPMNAYSKYFAGRLGFKDEDVARKSVALIDRMHRQFDRVRDRAGQHHALMMALVMFNRARWTGKGREAEIFRQWLLDRLREAAPAEAAPEEEPDQGS